MARQIVSSASPNDKWLKAPVDSEELTSKSEVVNDLIRKARWKVLLGAKLIRAAQSGFSNLSATEILAKSKEELWRNGEL